MGSKWILCASLPVMEEEEDTIHLRDGEEIGPQSGWKDLQSTWRIRIIDAFKTLHIESVSPRRTKMRTL